MKLLRYADARVVAATVPGAVVLLSDGIPAHATYARLVAITRRRGRPTRAVVAWCGTSEPPARTSTAPTRDDGNDDGRSA